VLHIRLRLRSDVGLLTSKALISDFGLCTDGRDLTHFASDRCHGPLGRSVGTHDGVVPQLTVVLFSRRKYFRYVRHAVWVRLKEKTTAQEIVIGP
jgi:hypothetical protein